MKNIIHSIIALCKEKAFYYTLLSTFIILFLMYHNNFFRPYNFWLMYSFMSMFLLPVYFYIFMENKNKVKWFAFTAFIILIIFTPLIMYIKPLKKLLSGETLSLITASISAFPLIIIMIIKKKLIIDKLGLNFKNFKLSLLITIVGIAIMVPIVIIASRHSDFSKIYPFFGVMKQGGFKFVLYQFYFLLFFIIWEFFFRGFMLFTFTKHIKNINIAVLLHAVIFAFAHFGKPEIETASSFFGAILLGFIILRVKNIFPAVIIHFVTALTMDIISVFFS